MILLIDNYDSFTYNLYHYLGEAGAKVEVCRNDQTTVEEVLARIESGDVTGIVLSPGPCTPNEAGICVDLVKAAAGKVPLLGVCLGHQSIGQAFGGNIIRAPEPVHGKVHTICNTGKGIFDKLPKEFEITRYHSLIIEKDSLPKELEITAESADGLIMAIQHKELPVFGVQFHPESIASQYGHELLANFWQTCYR
jgi:anthranilate synthase component 2